MSRYPDTHCNLHVLSPCLLIHAVRADYLHSVVVRKSLFTASNTGINLYSITCTGSQVPDHTGALNVHASNACL